MVEKTKNDIAQGDSPSNPLQSMVGELLFFARVTDLLQGLCSKLNVRVNYLEIMANHAKTALVAETRRAIYNQNKDKSKLNYQNLDEDKDEHEDEKNKRKEEGRRGGVRDQSGNHGDAGGVPRRVRERYLGLH